MALYKHSSYLHSSNHQVFDQVFDPGTPAPYAGIYRCTKCGPEIGIAAGHILPPQSHPQHPAKLGSIEWQMVACAQHNV